MTVFVRFLEGNDSRRSVFPSENAFSTLKNQIGAEEKRVKPQASFQEILNSKLGESLIFRSEKPSIESPQGIEPRCLSSLFALLPGQRVPIAPSTVPKAYKKMTRPSLPDESKNIQFTSVSEVKKPTLTKKARHLRTPGPKHQLSTVQSSSVIFFNSLEAKLLEDFTRDELKQAYRLLALRLHPDRQGGSAKQFIELKGHYETLKKLFK